MFYCYKCGKVIPDDQKFCGYCGTAVPAVAQQQPAAMSANVSVPVASAPVQNETAITSSVPVTANQTLTTVLAVSPLEYIQKKIKLLRFWRVVGFIAVLIAQVVIWILCKEILAIFVDEILRFWGFGTISASDVMVYALVWGAIAAIFSSPVWIFLKLINNTLAKYEYQELIEKQRLNIDNTAPKVDNTAPLVHADNSAREKIENQRGGFTLLTAVVGFALGCLISGLLSLGSPWIWFISAVMAIAPAVAVYLLFSRKLSAYDSQASKDE